MQYSQINFDNNQMQGRVRALPTRWTSPGGVTISSFDRLSRAALFGLGWVPVVYAEVPDTETHKHSLTPIYDEDSRSFIYPAEARDIDLLKTEAMRTIDLAASDTCARYTSSGCAQDGRYILKHNAAAAYQAAIASDANVVETDLFFYQEAINCGMTVAEKAAEILGVFEIWSALAAKIEAVRLGSKKACSEAETAGAVVAARSEAVSALEAI